MMKKFLFTVFSFLVCNVAFAKEYEVIVSEIEKDSLADVMSMNHDMIMSELGSGGKKLNELLKDIEEMRVFMNNGENKEKLNLFRNKIREIETSDLEVIIKVSNKEEKVRIYAKNENEHIKDVIILVDSDEGSIMVIMRGNIKRDVFNRMLESGFIKVS